MLIAGREADDMPRMTRWTVRPWEPIEVSTKPLRKCPASFPTTQPFSRRILPPGVKPATVWTSPLRNLCSPSWVVTVPVKRMTSPSARAIASGR